MSFPKFFLINLKILLLLIFFINLLTKEAESMPIEEVASEKKSLISLKNLKNSKTLPLAYKTKKINRVSKINSDAEWNLSIPIFYGTESAKIINKKLYYIMMENDLASAHGNSLLSPEKVAKDFIDFAEMTHEDGEIGIPVYFSASCEIIFNRYGILSLRSNFSEYSGGVHPNHYTSNDVFDANTGREILLNDILNQDKIKDLNIMVDDKFRKLFRSFFLKPNEKINEEDFVLYRNTVDIEHKEFLIKETGIELFYYSNSYAAPDIIIEFDWKEILPLLKD